MRKDFDSHKNGVSRALLKYQYKANGKPAVTDQCAGYTRAEPRGLRTVVAVFSPRAPDWPKRIPDTCILYPLFHFMYAPSARGVFLDFLSGEKAGKFSELRTH